MINAKHFEFVTSTLANTANTCPQLVFFLPLYIVTYSSFYSCRTKTKQLRREKTLEMRQIHEEEQRNLKIALKDLKSKLTTAKQRELEIQRDTLGRK